MNQWSSPSCRCCGAEGFGYAFSVLVANGRRVVVDHSRTLAFTLVEDSSLNNRYKRRLRINNMSFII